MRSVSHGLASATPAAREEACAMMLTPREIEKLSVYVLADVARRRRDRGTKLNYAEAIALIAGALPEGARDGRTVREIIDVGRTNVHAEECPEGAADRIPAARVDANFAGRTQ